MVMAIKKRSTHLVIHLTKASILVKKKVLVVKLGLLQSIPCILEDVRRDCRFELGALVVAL